MSDKILKFQASWCQPCKMLSKAIEGEDLGVVVEEVDIDDNRDLAIQYGVRGVPTMVLVREGTEVARVSGYMSADKVREWVSASTK